LIQLEDATEDDENKESGEKNTSEGLSANLGNLKVSGFKIEFLAFRMAGWLLGRSHHTIGL
jgi:hypothetical protein